MFVLVTGGTGLVGSSLCRKLKLKGYAVGILSRTERYRPDILLYSWNPEDRRVEQEAIERADIVVHLAGENIFEKRWTKKEKQRILDSRVNTAGLLLEKFRTFGKKPKAFISASATGYYGAVTSGKVFTEADGPGNDFLARVCLQWEKAADRFTDWNVRTVKIRTAPVLATEGGLFKKTYEAALRGFAAPFGNGQQYFPWIHLDDLCGIYIKAIEDEAMRGAYNAVAPEIITNAAYMKEVAACAGRKPRIKHIPAFALHLMLGEASSAMLQGSPVSAQKIEDAGFEFAFPTLERAMADLCKK
jgi:hypothetical protein